MIVLPFQIKIAWSHNRLEHSENVEKPVSDLNSNTDAPGSIVEDANSKLLALVVADQPGVDIGYITNVESPQQRGQK